MHKAAIRSAAAASKRSAALSKYTRRCSAEGAGSTTFQYISLLSSRTSTKDHRDICAAPVFEISDIQEVVEAAIILARICAGFCRLHLGADPLRQHPAGLRVPQLQHAVDAGFKTAADIECEANRHGALGDQKFAALPDQLTRR